jgi:hypothetical protein
MKRSYIASLFAALALTSPALASAVTVFYGDDDGFGVGATTFKDPLTDSASGGEAPGTDVRLIGSGFAAPPFAPAATLTFGAAPISSVKITMSMAEFGGDISPVDGPNSIVLDGTAIPTSFLGSFTSFANGADPNIETLFAFLPPALFPLFADGSVDLTGTRITERGGFTSFQIDYIRFDITTSVPEPGSMTLVGLGLLGLAFARRRKSH